MKAYKHVGIVGVTAVGAALCYKEIVIEGIKRFKHCPEISMHAHPQNEFDVADFNKITSLILESIENVKRSGAEFAIIPANTAHYVFEDVQAVSPLPLLSIIDLTINDCLKRKVSKVSVLGTFPTMQFSLYRDKLKNAGIQLVEPSHEEKERLDAIIAEELLLDHVDSDTVKEVQLMIEGLKDRGSQLVILACTELPIIISDHNSVLPCIDTTRLLAEKTLMYAADQLDESEQLKVRDQIQAGFEIEVMNENDQQMSEEIREAYNDNVDKVISECKLLLDQGKFKQAKNMMEDAVKKEPVSPEAHAWFAIALGRLIENSSVLNKMRLLPIFERETLRALEIAPDLLLARKVNGMRLLNTPEAFGGNVKKAIAEFQYCLQKGLEDDELYFSLAQAYIKLKDVEEGRKALHSSLQLNPEHKLAKKHLDMLEVL
jgi:aspartate racemase